MSSPGLSRLTCGAYLGSRFAVCLPKCIAFKPRCINMQKLLYHSTLNGSHVHPDQMCSKDPRDTSGAGTDIAAVPAVAAPARFDNRPAFRQNFAGAQEHVKYVFQAPSLIIVVIIIISFLFLPPNPLCCAVPTSPLRRAVVVTFAVRPATCEPPPPGPPRSPSGGPARSPRGPPSSTRRTCEIWMTWTPTVRTDGQVWRWIR